MSARSDLSQALLRIREVFRATPGIELTDTDVAKLAGLDPVECRIVLGELQRTHAIERLRDTVFVCRPTSWWVKYARY